MLKRFLIGLFKNENPALIIFMGVLLVLRLWLARLIGCRFAPEQYYDDTILVQYADLYSHFIAQDLPAKDLLVKDIGFPLILSFVKASGLVYTDLISLMYFAAALSAVMLFRVLSAKKNFLRDAAIFAFVLFMPIAFDFNAGTPLYRNAVLPPLYFIVMTMMTLIFARHFIKPHAENVAFNIIFGVIFTLTYYIKEDGLWLLICLAAVTAICFVKLIAEKFLSDSQRLRYIAILLLPLFIFAGGTVVYKGVNKIFFGVYLINNRTEGELGDFVKQVYKIKANGRRASIWAPTDAINQAFNASETLRGNSNLRGKVFNNNWFGDITKTPIHGDFLGWVMLSALYDSGTCKTPIEQEEFLSKVNAELDAAFDAGILQRDDRFQIVSSMGGMTAREIFSLTPLVLREYFSHVTTYYYLPGALPLDFAPYAEKFDFPRRPEDYGLKSLVMTQNTEPAELIDKAEAVTNMNFRAENPRAAVANSLAEKIFIVYSLIQSLLFVAAVIGVCGSLRELIRRTRKFSLNEYLILAVACGEFMLSIAYAFAIAWFCYFLRENGNDIWLLTLKYYSTALVPMLMTFEISGAYLFCRLYKNFKKERLKWQQ